MSIGQPGNECIPIQLKYVLFLRIQHLFIQNYRIFDLYISLFK